MVESSGASRPSLAFVIGANVALSLVAVVLAVGIAEACFRFRTILPNVPTGDRYAPHDNLTHTFASNVSMTINVHPDIPPYLFKTNELGLRIGEPYALKKPKGTKRIMVIGDSFVEGFDYAKTVPALLEKGLADAARAKGFQLEIIHAGIGGYSPVQHFITLERRGHLELSPDVVVLAIDMTDAMDDHEACRPILQWEDGGPSVPNGIRIKKILLRDGMVDTLSIFSRDFWIAASAKHLKLGNYVFDKRAELFASQYPDVIRTPASRHAFSHLMFEPGNPETLKMVEYSQGWVLKIIELLRARGIQVVITMYPYRVQLDEPGLQPYFELYRKFAEAHDVPFHLALADFLAHPAREQLFLANDTHYNYQGTELWAGSLVRFLTSRMEGLFAASP